MHHVIAFSVGSSSIDSLAIAGALTQGEPLGGAVAHYFFARRLGRPASLA